jgi:hypothetical protein
MKEEGLKHCSEFQLNLVAYLGADMKGLVSVTNKRNSECCVNVKNDLYICWALERDRIRV